VSASPPTGTHRRALDRAGRLLADLAALDFAHATDADMARLLGRAEAVITVLVAAVTIPPTPEATSSAVPDAPKGGTR
jgi:hypothetical protein